MSEIKITIEGVSEGVIYVIENAFNYNLSMVKESLLDEYGNETGTEYKVEASGKVKKIINEGYEYYEIGKTPGGVPICKVRKIEK